MRRVVLLLVAVTACKGEPKSNRREDPKPPPVAADAAAVDPACLTKAKDLQQFLETFLVEVDSYEINMGWTPALAEKTPAAVPQNLDYLLVTPKTVSAYDVSESNHVDNNIGPGKPADARLETTFEMKGKERDAGPEDHLRIDIDATVPWEEVARIVTAAQKAGYTEAVFAVEPKFVMKEWGGLAAQTTDEKEVEAAQQAIKALYEKCPAIESALLSKKEAQAKEMGEGLAKCNCAIDHEELKRQIFKRDRWHQAHPRAGLVVKLAADGAKVSQPKAMPWSEAHAALLAAEGKPVVLEAK